MKKIFFIEIILVITLVIINMYIWNNGKVISTPNLPVILSGQKGESDIDTIYCATLPLVWNEMIDYYELESIEFENYTSELIERLNKKLFTKEMISPDSYYIKVGAKTPELKNQIIEDLTQKFSISKNYILDNIDFESQSNEILLYAVLEKKLTFLEEFDILKAKSFNQSKEDVEYFGIDSDSEEKLYQNVEILYYDYVKNNPEAAIKLQTKENEEIILYIPGENGEISQTFEELYMKINELELKYNDLFETTYVGMIKEFNKNDSLMIPNINLDFIIKYDELCNKEIKGTNGVYISDVIQNIKFELNQKGAELFSESAIINDYMSGAVSDARILNFDKPFVMFLKEKDMNNFYFAIKIEDTEYLKIGK